MLRVWQQRGKWFVTNDGYTTVYRLLDHSQYGPIPKLVRVESDNHVLNNVLDAYERNLARCETIGQQLGCVRNVTRAMDYYFFPFSLLTR